MAMTDFIRPLEMNGLTGRMLYMPAPKNKKRNTLLIYGHHASIERMYGIAEDLNQYGSVTLPDLPGFGGMDSFYKIGMKPSIDTMADYLAAFIKLRFKNQKISVCGMSLGFVIVTRMLQKYPKMVKQVDLLVSVVGFVHHDDLKFTRPRYLFYRYLSAFFSVKPTASFFHNVILSPFALRLAYSKMHNAKSKFANLSEADNKRTMDFEIYLWRCNDVRTYMRMTTAMLTIDNCEISVDLPVEHISVDKDQYFNHAYVEQHMRIVFNDFTEHKAIMDTHAPSIIADKQAAHNMIPKRLRGILARSPE